MELHPGLRLRSQVCDTELVVVRAEQTAVEICCGGHPMVTADQERSPTNLELEEDAGTLLGKRYEHKPTGLEVLCTKPGRGSLTVNGEQAVVKKANALPSSD